MAFKIDEDSMEGECCLSRVLAGELGRDGLMCADVTV